MRILSPELLVVLVLIAFAIVEILRRSRSRQQPPRQPAGTDPGESAEPVWRSTQAQPPAAYPVPSAPAIHFGRSAAPVAVVPIRRGRFSRKSLLGTRDDLRKAIVIATILGPCRAVRPGEHS